MFPSTSATPSPSRVSVIDGLRGLASFAVCWYHLVYADGAFNQSGLIATTLRNSARNAWTGVEVFFVISGFVIPLALYRSRYTIQAYGSFIVKRVIRLDPPYLVSVVLCVILWYLSATLPHLHGPAFHLSLMALLLHIGYLNAFFGQGWLNPVYWTLAIEFQYYLGVGLLFWALGSRRWSVRLAAFALLAALALLIPGSSLVFRYLFVFMLGMATFQRYVGLLGPRMYLLTVAVLAIGAKLTLGPMVATVAVLTALVIAFVRRDLPLLGWLGTISYSLYLVHVPIGGRVMNLGLPHAHTATERVLVLLVALIVTLSAATSLYLLVERPAQRWSSRRGYGKRRTRLDSSADRPGASTVTSIAEP